MRYLEKGLYGDDVKAWSTFLCGLYPQSHIVVSCNFDDSIDLWTKQFQKDHGNSIDGVVGPKTLADALKLGFDPLDSSTHVDDSGPNWPPQPNDVHFLSYADREKVFGKFVFVPNPTQYNPEGIKITDGWAANNIVTVTIPQLMSVPGVPAGGRVQINKLIQNQFIAMFGAWEQAGLSKLVLSWAGSFVPRYVRGSRTYLSNHAWGSAFDINVPWNGLGTNGALKGQKGSVRELVQIAIDHGFAWGGWWKERSDPQHFEAFKLI